MKMEMFLRTRPRRHDRFITTTSSTDADGTGGQVLVATLDDHAHASTDLAVGLVVEAAARAFRRPGFPQVLGLPLAEAGPTKTGLWQEGRCSRRF